MNNHPAIKDAVILFVKVSAKAESIQKAKEALLADVNGARTEPGNYKMELYQANDNDPTFFLIERWKNQAALEEHLKQPYTAAAFELQKTDLTAPIEMNYLADLWPTENMLQKQKHRRLTTLIVPFEIKPGKAAAFIHLFEAFVPKVRAEQGNVEFHFHRIINNDNCFVLYERWENKEDLDRHNSFITTAAFASSIEPLLTRPVADFVLSATDIS